MPTVSQPYLDELRPMLEALVDVVRLLARQGWTPATSSNFSLRCDEQTFLISASGLDKGDLTPDDFLPVDAEGRPLQPETFRGQPSAETLLHGWVYRRFPRARVVLHTHSVSGTVLGKLYQSEGRLLLTGYEMLKVFEGIDTHEATVMVPVFPNSQDMKTLAAEIDNWYHAHTDQPLYGFLLAGHGLYCWGDSPAQARRYAETFEFLFECTLKLRGH